MKSSRSMPFLIALLTVSSALSGTVSWAQSAAVHSEELELGTGGRLVTDIEFGELEIRGTDSSTARVEIRTDAEDFASRYDYEIRMDGDTLSVRSWRLEERSRWSRDRIRFEITVPRSTAVDAQSKGGPISAEGLESAVRVFTAGGPISVSDVRGDLDVKTSGGPISLRDIVGSALADTSGGPISAENISGDLVAETSGGPIDIDEAGGRVEAHTSGGPVIVRFARGNAGGGNVSSSGGPVTVAVDGAVGLEVDAESHGGEVRSSLPVAADRQGKRVLTGSLNGGGASLQVRNSGGPISLRAL